MNKQKIRRAIEKEERRRRKSGDLITVDAIAGSLGEIREENNISYEDFRLIVAMIQRESE